MKSTAYTFWALTFILLSLLNKAKARDTTAYYEPWKGNLEISGYIEAYYLYDFSSPKGNMRAPFVYSHNRHNEFNVNMAMLKLSYNAPRVRANAAGMVGTYNNANLANEPNILKNIFEANVGVNLLKRNRLWLDAGVFASHIGFESAIGKDCKTLTRSMLADNSPYYESGAKLTYQSNNDKLLVSALILNGWQHIWAVKGNSLPSFGWQVLGKPVQGLTINSSSFIGSDKPDNDRRMRYFHNFYITYEVSDKGGLTVGFDVGAEQKFKGSKQYSFWYAPVLIAWYAPVKQLSITARAEYYRDEYGVIIGTTSPGGFGLLGYSANIDVTPFKNALLRIEGRMFQSTQGTVFEVKNGSTKYSPSLALSFCYSFSHVFNSK